jgi:hypothetical protein
MGKDQVHFTYAALENNNKLLVSLLTRKTEQYVCSLFTR